VYFGLTMRTDPLQRYCELFEPSAEGRAVDFRGYNVGHTVPRLTFRWDMQRFFSAIALLKQNMQEISADQTLLAGSPCHCPLILNS